MVEATIDISAGGVTQSITAFDAICMIAGLTCIGYTAALVHRGRGRPRTLPLETALSCLVAWILYLAFDIIVFVAISTNQNPSSVIEISDQNAMISGFQWLATCLTFHVFYALIHLMLGETKAARPSTPWRKTRSFHWVCFGLVVLIACLSFVMLCVLLYAPSTKEDTATFVLTALSRRQPRSLRGLLQLRIWRGRYLWRLSIRDVWGAMSYVHPSNTTRQTLLSLLQIQRCMDTNWLQHPTLLLITATTFWSISNCLIAVEIWLVCLATNFDVLLGTIFNVSLIVGGLMRVVGALSRIMYWAAIVIFCFRWTSIQKEGGLGRENDEALDSLNKKEEEVTETEFQTVWYEADSKAFVAELPGDYNQVCEAESHQIAEMGSSENYELADFESPDLKDKTGSVPEAARI